MPLMCRMSNTAKTSVSSGVTWNSQSWVLGPGGDQAVSSRPSNQRQRTPDSRTCCDGDVARRVDGGWQNGAGGDWQLLTLERNIRLATADNFSSIVYEYQGTFSVQTFTSYLAFYLPSSSTLCSIVFTQHKYTAVPPKNDEAYWTIKSPSKVLTMSYTDCLQTKSQSEWWPVQSTYSWQLMISHSI